MTDQTPEPLDPALQQAVDQENAALTEATNRAITAHLQGRVFALLQEVHALRHPAPEDTPDAPAP